MISLISTILNAILSFLIFILKAFFSMLTWFLKSIWKLLKLFFCFLPITSILFTLLFFADIYLFFMGIPDIKYLSDYNNLLSKDIQVSLKLFSDLRIWWTLNIYPYRGSIVFFLLIALSVIMILPVATVLFSISVVLSFGQLLFYAVVVDMAFYLIRAILKKSFVSQFLDRFYKVFPERGKRHYEKNYEKWLRRHHDEFEEDYEDKPRRSRADEFYEDYDDEYEDEDYDDEYEDDDYEYDRYIEEDDEDYDDFYEDEEGEDDEDDDFYEDYEDDEDDDSSFNFFAGCSSLESVDRKYKSLVKLYHPDNMDGDTAALQEINVQYTKAKKRLG